MTDLISRSILEKKISTIVSPTIESLGYELVRLRLTDDEPSTLQVMADSTSGTFNVDDCAKISTDISTILDVEDPIEKEYTLEVSSPGIDRPLTRLKDFEDWCGYQVKLETLELVDGQRRFKGNLLGVDNDSVVLELNGKKLKIDFYLLSDAKLILTDTLIKDVLKNRKDFEKFDTEKFDEIDETVPEEGED